MKNIILAVCIGAPIFTVAQTDTAKIPIPMKNGLVVYEKSYTVSNNAGKGELLKRAVQWMKTSFPEFGKNIKTDKATGLVTGIGIFKVPVSTGGNYYWLKPSINITVADGSYTFQAYSFYEKPVEKGITNDYSKIEYRWRDFRKGRPWSAEDYALFKGLDENTLSLMASLETAMTK